MASLVNPHDICFPKQVCDGERSRVKNLYNGGAALPLDKLPPLPDNFEVPEDVPPALLRFMGASPEARKKYDETFWRICRYIYNRLTERVDDEIGVILDALKEAGVEDNTLIVFTSDHGDMDGCHRMSSKGQPFEQSVGIPLIMKYRGVIPAGKVDREHLVSTGLDLLPTFCDYAGVDIPDEGKSEQRHSDQRKKKTEKRTKMNLSS